MQLISNPKELMPEIAWNWLTDKSSLTKRLREFTNNEISFHLLHEDWGVANEQPSWLRKIQWRLHDSCWIEADLIIPKSSINSETKCLLDTHERPIGEQLFQEPSLKRSDFRFYQPDDFEAIKPVWIRVSTFHFKQQPLTLKETFYAEFFKAITTYNPYTA